MSLKLHFILSPLVLHNSIGGMYVLCFQHWYNHAGSCCSSIVPSTHPCMHPECLWTLYLLGEVSASLQFWWTWGPIWTDYVEVKRSKVKAMIFSLVLFPTGFWHAFLLAILNPSFHLDLSDTKSFNCRQSLPSIVLCNDSILFIFKHPCPSFPYYNVMEKVGRPDEIPAIYTCCTKITGSTVVLTCCKDDSSSQWETPIIRPPQTENPLTDLDKICHQWLRRRRDPSHQIW